MFPEASYIHPKEKKLVARQEPSGHRIGRQAAVVVRRASKKLWPLRRSHGSLGKGAREEGCLLDANSTNTLKLDVVDDFTPTVASPTPTSTATASPTEASSTSAAQTGTWRNQYTLLGSSRPVTVPPQRETREEPPPRPAWSLDAFDFIVPLPPPPCELTDRVQEHIKTYAKWYDFDITYLVRLTYFDAAGRDGNPASSLPSPSSSSIHLASAHLIAVHGREFLPGALHISPAFHRQVMRKRWHHSHFPGTTEFYQPRYGWAAAHCVADRPHHGGLDYLVFGGCRLSMPNRPSRLALDDTLLRGLELSVHSLAQYVAAAS
ncbi:hypothetical protein MY11210_008638 [Beauveria gryllotalpidicola]